jgi:hypothetical protein
MKKFAIAGVAAMSLAFAPTADASLFGGAFSSLINRVKEAAKGKAKEVAGAALERARSFATNAINVVKEAAKNHATGFRKDVTSAFRTFFSKNLESIKGQIRQVGSGLLGAVQKAGLSAWEQAKRGFFQGWKQGKGFNKIKLGFSNAWRMGFRSFRAGLKDGAKGVFSKALGHLKRDFGKNFRVLREKIVKAGKKAGKGFVQDVKSGLGGKKPSKRPPRTKRPKAPKAPTAAQQN